MPFSIGNKAYSPIKDFAELSGDMSTINGTIFFNEGKILKIDNGYAFCFAANRIDDLKKPDSFMPGMQVCWVAHNKEYELYKYPEGKVPVQPAKLEIIVIDWLENKTGQQWLNKSFKGKLHLNGAESMLKVVVEKELWSIIAEFDETEPSLIKELIPKSSSGGFKKTSQSQLEQLSEREKWLITTCKPYGEGSENLSALAISLASMKQDIPEAFEIFIQLAKLVLKD